MEIQIGSKIEHYRYGVGMVSEVGITNMKIIFV
jgi:hypothetical protein